MNNQLIKRQDGVMLVIIMLGLLGITLVGVSSAKNSNGQLLMSRMFSKYVEIDQLADDASSCVFHKMRSGSDDEFVDWIGKTMQRNQTASMTASEDESETENGVKGTNDLNNVVASFATNIGDDGDGCLTEGAEVESLSASTSHYDQLKGKTTALDHTRVKDMSVICWALVAEGSDLGTYANYMVATSGDGMIKKEAGTRLINVTAWEAFAPYISDYCTADECFAHINDVICEV